MKLTLSLMFMVVFHAVGSLGPLHASCKIHWSWAVKCSMVNDAIVNQIQKWHSNETCPGGKGEKCLYTLESQTDTEIKAIHETPKKHYKDDLTFTFTANGTELCSVEGYSTSETWYAVLDYGTNYCNLHNLITGAGLDKMPKYSEETTDSICTQYSSADCEKY
ncbi:unnamed protein product [Pocillopora meandrina]|uniref:Uncharacterized protein n=1 Tax=Pocillopora meandrina TaxID=46732 RepID=A0AAU9XSH5_9CNID|nr:unnamed protein product [Pocillopora meandrina]